MIWVVVALKYLPLLLICLFFMAIFFHSRRGGKIKKATLLVIRSGSATVPEGKRWELGKGVILGRSSDCAVNLPDPYVSNRHTRVVLQDNRYYVADLGSTNGTFLEDRLLIKPQILRNGSHLQIGGFTFKAELPERSKASRSFLLPLFPGLILTAGSLELYREHLLHVQDIAPLTGAVLFLVISSLMAEFKVKGDALPIHLVGVLSALGLAFVWRVNPYYGLRQTYWVLAGCSLFWLIQIFLSAYRRLLDYKYIFMVLSVVFLIFTILFGVEAGGARSWLSLGSFRFQASEFVKVFMVIFLAGYLENYFIKPFIN